MYRGAIISRFVFLFLEVCVGNTIEMELDVHEILRI